MNLIYVWSICVYTAVRGDLATDACIHVKLGRKALRSSSSTPTPDERGIWGLDKEGKTHEVGDPLDRTPPALVLTPAVPPAVAPKWRPPRRGPGNYHSPQQQQRRRRVRRLPRQHPRRITDTASTGATSMAQARHEHTCDVAAASTAAATAVTTRRRGEGRRIPATPLQVSNASRQCHLLLTAPSLPSVAAHGRVVYAARPPFPGAGRDKRQHEDGHDKCERGHGYCISGHVERSTAAGRPVTASNDSTGAATTRSARVARQRTVGCDARRTQHGERDTGTDGRRRQRTTPTPVTEADNDADDDVNDVADVGGCARWVWRAVRELCGQPTMRTIQAGRRWARRMGGMSGGRRSARNSVPYSV
ncbi:hypothetical protein BJ912DRAFT_927447 [Pholiota molesta]|nr:hypothetical protein BJ912DRAFT_927447 [Pholiota molesta]